MDPLLFLALLRGVALLLSGRNSLWRIENGYRAGFDPSLLVFGGLKDNVLANRGTMLSILEAGYVKENPCFLAFHLNKAKSFFIVPLAHLAFEHRCFPDNRQKPCKYASFGRNCPPKGSRFDAGRGLNCGGDDRLCIFAIHGDRMHWWRPVHR